MAEIINAHRGVVRTPEGKRTAERIRSTNVHLREISCGGGDFIHMPQERNQWRTR